MILPGGLRPTIGDSSTLISNQTGNLVNGTFDNLPEGPAKDINGVWYQVSYVGGQSIQDVTLTVVAAPTAIWTGGTDNLWSDAANWQGDIVPVSGADVTIDQTNVGIAMKGVQVDGINIADHSFVLMAPFTLDDNGTLGLAGARVTSTYTGDTAVAGGSLLLLDGLVSLDNASFRGSLINSYAPASGDVITLISNNRGKAVVGTFAGLPEGAPVTVGGASFTISYHGGVSQQDVTLTQATPTPLAAARLVVVRQPASTSIAGQPIGTVIVDIEDAQGNLVTTDSSSVMLSSSTMLGGTTIVQAVGGVETFTNLSISYAGTYALLAVDGTLAAATSNSFHLTPAAAVKLVVTQQPPSAAAAGQMIGTVAIEVEDVYGNIVTTDQSDVTISVFPGGAVTSGLVVPILTGTVAVAAQSGTALFSDLAITQGGTYPLSATDGVLDPAVTAPLTIAPAPAPAFAPAPASVVIAGTTGSALVINPATAFGQSSGIFNWLKFCVANASGNEITLLSRKVRVEHGLATLRNLKIRVAGVYDLSVSDAFGHTISQRVTIVPSTPARLGFATHQICRRQLSRSRSGS